MLITWLSANVTPPSIAHCSTLNIKGCLIFLESFGYYIKYQVSQTMCIHCVYTYIYIYEHFMRIRFLCESILLQNVNITGNIKLYQYKLINYIRLPNVVVYRSKTNNSLVTRVCVCREYSTVFVATRERNFIPVIL